MKHSNNTTVTVVDIIALVMPILLIIPNIALDFTEQMTWWAKLFNIIVPLSFYSVCFSLWRRTPLLTFLSIPMMCFAGFQIVLLYLYGSSIIGVDMFLNVVTTNAAEVNELLGNLLVAIGIILVLYLPPIILAVIGSMRKWRLSRRIQRPYLTISSGIFITSVIAMLLCGKIYSPTDDLYPVNIFKNLYLAVVRTGQVSSYPETSAGFSYNAVSSRNQELNETYVLIIGETSRAANWELCGYSRDTNPKLSERDDIAVFKKAISQSNTTHKSVPLMLSDLTAENFDSINYRKSLITAFKEAGFYTAFLSNQKRNRSYTEFFSNEADTTIYLPDTAQQQPFDSELLKLLSDAVSDSTHNKKLIVLHTYGSHFNYRDRYPDSFSYFKPDNISNANVGHRNELINAFDNSIRFVDSVLASSIETLDSLDNVAALIYAPDHGEDIFDDYRERFLHASPVPTSYQLRVPMIIWQSNEFDTMFPDLKKAMNGNLNDVVSPSVAIFHTLLDMAGIESDYLDRTESVVSENYRSPKLLFLTDRNIAVSLNNSGIKEIDRDNLFRDLELKHL